MNAVAEKGELASLECRRGGVRSRIARWAPIPLRVVVGYGFMAHGYAKIVHHPSHFAAILHALGVPAPELTGWLTILIELVGGLAVLAGVLVPLVSVPMAAVLLVAMVTVHLPYGFSSVKLQTITAGRPQFGPPGYEVDLLYLACLATLVLAGSGPLAIDNIFAKTRSRSGDQVQLSSGASPKPASSFRLR
ncbi:MAG TPA: DoxX family protein [Candidatus Binatia bacterium]|nr:DoxX family protein [Candidatus Binatia bacterium]